ncbi:tetratricopeptide repeat protein [Alishewanella sp. HL-SH05]|uniref:tetratricopeptide repeat protein n=1 Tax=Alishewanella sp. HL-SH05 TaxID=3461145 RepID=UPI004042AE9B
MRHPMPWLLLSVLATTLLTACSTPTEKVVRRPTLGEFMPYTPLSTEPPETVNADKLQQVYQSLLALAPAADVRQKVLYRLSQLNTQQLERVALPPAAEQQALASLIAQYQQLLQAYPDDLNNELIRYQLARALDLSGDNAAAQQQMQRLLQQFPRSEFAAELWFRIGDIDYSQANYSAALKAFNQVLGFAKTELKLHALYMRGWSHFQLQQYAQADEAFLLALDMTVQPNSLDEQQSLQQELQRILSISLSYQEQASSLLALLQRTPFQDKAAERRPLAFQAQLFQGLADFLFEKDLQQAALDSYRQFITYQPFALEAAQMQLKIVQYHLAQADAAAAEQAQLSFVSLFGPASAFWQKALPREQADLAPILAQYLDYFARQRYQLAQQAAVPEQASLFAEAVPFWQQLLVIQPFVAAEQVDDSLLWPDDVRYLLAESLAASGQPKPALALYQQLGYGVVDLNARNVSAEQAAYRALLLSERIYTTAKMNNSEDLSELSAAWWHEQNQFVRWHSRHPAAQQIALNQLTDQYQRKAFAEVASFARRVTEWPHPELSQPALVNEARFIVSQTLLAQDDFAAAEQNIEPLLALYQNDASELGRSRTQLLTAQRASAIYQQAQLGYLSVGAQLAHLQRLLALPTSEYHQSAAYQQISLQLEQQAWAEAIELMLAYQQQYPNSSEQTAISLALLNSYEQLQDWQQAADLLSEQIERLAEGSEQQRILAKAADYYLRAGNRDAARSAYRNYANRYPEPHLAAQEARAVLVQLYQADNDLTRRNFWYQQLVSAEQQQAQGTERSRYLAADAALQLGLYHSRLFEAVLLQQPLRDNLRKKQAHMTTAIEQLQTSMGWQVADFYSQAQYQVASLYQQMAGALLTSQRPKGLDALALEQYDLLLEEQAYPFEELAIEIHQQNAALVTQPLYDQWVAASFAKLAELSPARYRKPEVYLELADDAY